MILLSFRACDNLWMGPTEDRNANRVLKEVDRRYSISAGSVSAVKSGLETAHGRGRSPRPVHGLPLAGDEPESFPKYSMFVTLGS